MHKKLLVFFIFFSPLVLVGCGKQVEDVAVFTGDIQSFTTTYEVGSSPVFHTTLYGTVIADSVKNILTNRGGMLEFIDCQPGKEVSKNTIIAKIAANPDDLSYQNNEIQLSVLRQQLHNLSSVYGLTEDTLALQKTILQHQYDTNATLLSNLGKSKGYTDNSLAYQSDLLDQQYDTLMQSKSIDLDKMKTSVANTYKQYMIMIKDALKKIDDTFSSANFFVSDKDARAKQAVLSTHAQLKNKLSDTMTTSEFSDYLLDISDLMSLAASSILATTASSGLPQSSPQGLSIDGLYTIFTTLSSTFISSKSAFDTLASSYDSVKNTYNSQINTLSINTNNFSENTAPSSALQLENQKTSLQLTQKTLETQLISSTDSQAIQLSTLKNQLLTMKQNITVLSNSLDGEILYAGVDGVVKMRALGENNKVAPNTLLCQILPKDPANSSIQIYSYKQISLGSTVGIFNNQGIFLGTGSIVYEYPYRDLVSQNYVYEIPVAKFALKENEKVFINLLQSADQKELRIPLQYIRPRLEGNLIRRKIGTGLENVYVNLGNINDGYVQILSGLTLGDTIVQ